MKKEDFKMEEKDLRLLIWIIVILTFSVTAFAIYYIYYILTFVPPEEIVINISQLNLE